MGSLFNMGGQVSGSSSSEANQTAGVYFIPPANDGSSPLVSPYAAGQGLDTINDALPASAAYLPATYAFTTTATPVAGTTSSLSLTTLLILGALGLGAWALLKGRL